MYSIWTKGREIKSNLGSSRTGGPGYNHYVRLFILSGIDIVISMPFNIWYFTSYLSHLSSWPGWKFVHSFGSQVAVSTTAEVRNSPKLLYQFEISRWSCVAYGFVFFALLGVTMEAREHYSSAWRYVSKIFCWKTGSLRESSRCISLRSLFRELIGLMT
jgi:Pheromone A receptor